MDQVRIACHGTSGHQIVGLMPELKRAKLVAISGVDEQGFQALKQRLPEAVGDTPRYPDLDTLLDECEFDLISLCSDWRAAQADDAIRALKAGKHVLAEKPMACSLDKLEELRRAAEESGKELRTMNPMVYRADFWGMKGIIDRGEIGDIVQIYAMKSYPYNDSRPQELGKDGGLTMQAGIHAVSFVRFVTGLEFGEIFCQDTKQGNPKEGELRRASNLSARMDNGALCVIVSNYCNPHAMGYHGNDQLRVFGTKGMIEIVDGGNRRMFVTDDKAPSEFPDGSPTHKYVFDLVDCILDGTPTLLTQEDSLVNTEVVLKAQKSADTGEVMRM